MGILSEAELEKTLFDSINACYVEGHALMTVDFFGNMIQFFDSDYNAYKAFLSPLLERGYITLEGDMGQAMRFGPNAVAWRERLERAFPASTPHIAHNNITITNSQNVNAAGHDVHISLTDRDMENAVLILRAIFAHPHTDGNLVAKVKGILDSGASAVETIKRIAGLIGLL